MAYMEELVALAKSYGRYEVEAYAFVGEGLRHAAKHFAKIDAEGEQRHLTATELVEGVLRLAANRFGLLAETVFHNWGIARSEDIGVITFHLIECGIFGKQPSDSIDDFNNGVDFPETLRSYVLSDLAEAVVKV